MKTRREVEQAMEHIIDQVQQQPKSDDGAVNLIAAMLERCEFNVSFLFSCAYAD